MLPESVKKSSKSVKDNIILECCHLFKYARFGEEKIEILRDITLSVSKGESVAICGASGSGKTTLLGILGGMDVSSSGSVSLAGIDLTNLSEDERAGLRAEKVGFVFQSFQLMPSLNALENVMLPLELKKHPNAESLSKEYLDRVGLTHRIGHFPSSLSGGEQQRVAIARAFACHPEILFADEPTGNLDGRTGHAVSDLLFDLNRENHTTLVLVTHDETLAARCDRIIHLEDGILVEAG